MSPTMPISTDETRFILTVRGAAWATIFVFLKEELAKGASLARMMNEKVRATLKHSGLVVPADELKSVTSKLLPELRAEVDAYYALRR